MSSKEQKDNNDKAGKKKQRNKRRNQIRNARRLEVVALDPKIQGKGDFWTNLRDFAPTAATLVGGLAGGPMGAAGGQAIGSGLSKLLGGKGDYFVRRNTISKRAMDKLPMGVPVPRFSNGPRTVRMVHDECLGDVVEPAANAGAFTVRSYTINPGIATTFSWFSALAQNFEQYKIEGMVFQYRPSSGWINNAAGAGIGLGMVIMSTTYDVLDPAFSTKIQMEASEFAMSAMPGQAMIHPIECARSETPIAASYVRTNATPATADARFYDYGNFQIATSGIPNNASAQTLGELWVSYDITLRKPCLQGGIAGFNVLSWKWQLPIATVAAGAYLGTTAATLVTGSALSPPTLATNAITFPVGLTGNYKLTYVVKGASTALTNTVSITTAGITALNLWYSDTVSATTVAAAATSTQQLFTYTFKFTTPATAATNITLAGGTLPTAITGADLWIEQINTAIVT